MAGSQCGSAKLAAIVVLSILAVAVCALLLMNFAVCRDWGIICENTGSRKGYREWFFGAKTGHWYRQSALELFVSSKRPNEPQHRWTSYAGTGKNVLGTAVLYGHGRPGPIITIRSEVLDQHVLGLDDAGKEALYEMLRSGDANRIEREIQRIYDALDTVP